MFFSSLFSLKTRGQKFFFSIERYFMIKKMAEADFSIEYPRAKFTYEHFQTMCIPELMIKIWHYSSEHGIRCNLCKIYKRDCINVLREKWTDEYIDVNMVLTNLCNQIKSWCNLEETKRTDEMYKLIKRHPSMPELRYIK